MNAVLDFATLRRSLLDWYDRHARSLPWRVARGEKPDPWAVLVSEMMLQQTTVATVLPRFPVFMARFPTLGAMADAPLDDVLHAWQGLGYYRRARLLHACARAVVERHGGVLPSTLEELRALPGLGRYTAAAVASIAFDRPVVAVDGNGERVLARSLGLRQLDAPAKSAVAGSADVLAGPHRPGDLSQALMDLGASVCTPRGPSCLLCPWQAGCAAHATGEPASFAVKPARAERPVRRAFAYLLVRDEDGAVLFRRRPATGLLSGMIELPSSDWNVAGHAPELDRDAPVKTRWRLIDGEVEHVFTHFRLLVRVATAATTTSHDGAPGGVPEGAHDAAHEGMWVGPAGFGTLALPTLTCKLLDHAGYQLPRRVARRPRASIGRHASGR